MGSVCGGLFVDDSAVVADPHGSAAVRLLGRHELDVAVVVTVVVPLDERGDPLTGHVFETNGLRGASGRYFTVLNSDSE